MRKLEIYKNLLDQGTYEGLRYKDEKKSRYNSFQICLDFLKDLPSPRIIELGTCRSFTDGKFEGCNSPDEKYWDPTNFSKWDFGAGCFSLLIGQTANYEELITLDLSPEHIRRCKIMTDSLGINCSHVVSNSIEYLEKTDKKFDLIYLDTGDMWPIEPICDLQLEECKIIVERNLLNSGGIILIDDVLNGTPKEMGDSKNNLGKSEKSIPYLLSMGYRIFFEGYQYILKK